MCNRQNLKCQAALVRQGREGGTSNPTLDQIPNLSESVRVLQLADSSW